MESEKKTADAVILPNVTSVSVKEEEINELRSENEFVDQVSTLPDTQKNIEDPSKTEVKEEYMDVPNPLKQSEKPSDQLESSRADSQQIVDTPNETNNSEESTEVLIKTESSITKQTEVMKYDERSSGSSAKNIDRPEVSPTLTTQCTEVSLENKKSSQSEECRTESLSAENSSLPQLSTGLSLLASQYDSDSDDDVREVPTSIQNYQNRVVEIGSDSESSTSDVELLSYKRSSIDLSLLEATNCDEEDEENPRNTRPPKVKGEFDLSDLPPIEDLHISVPAEECTELGQIQSIVDQLVVVNSIPGSLLLDLDTVLFLEKGKQVLGLVFDVLGQVSDPLYCIRFNSNKEIIEKGIQVGQKVYVAPKTEHTQFIVLANLMKFRGSDASWENDVEPPEKHLDYSDDEEERSARRAVRNKNRPADSDDETPKRVRPVDSDYSQRRPYYHSQRPHRGNFNASAIRQPFYPSPGNYNIAGSSWHSNYYQNYSYGQHQAPYQMPMRPTSNGYGVPPYGMPPPPSGMVINPYAMYPSTQPMQQSIYQHPPPPMPTSPPPPPPQM